MLAPYVSASTRRAGSPSAASSAARVTATVVLPGEPTGPHTATTRPQSSAVGRRSACSRRGPALRRGPPRGVDGQRGVGGRRDRRRRSRGHRGRDDALDLARVRVCRQHVRHAERQQVLDVLAEPGRRDAYDGEAALAQAGDGLAVQAAQVGGDEGCPCPTTGCAGEEVGEVGAASDTVTVPLRRLDGGDQRRLPRAGHGDEHRAGLHRVSRLGPARAPSATAASFARAPSTSRRAPGPTSTWTVLPPRPRAPARTRPPRPPPHPPPAVRAAGRHPARSGSGAATHTSTDGALHQPCGKRALDGYPDRLDAQVRGGPDAASRHELTLPDGSHRHQALGRAVAADR